jgi:phage baseplate assembly protein W
MAKPIVTSRTPDYADLDLDFLAHPTTGDVLVKTGQDAIKRSVRNLILTNYYEKPFRPGIGSNAIKLLFDNVTPLTSNFLRDAIYEVVKNYEPRVELINVDINFDYDNNGYNVTMQYVILNRNEPVQTSLFLERIR